MSAAKAAAKAAAAAPHVLVCAATADRDAASAAAAALEARECRTAVLLGDSVGTLLQRTHALQWTQVFAVVLTPQFAASSEATELLEFAKDRRRAIVVLQPDPAFVATGPAGAIAASAPHASAAPELAALVTGLPEVPAPLSADGGCPDEFSPVAPRADSHAVGPGVVVLAAGDGMAVAKLAQRILEEVPVASFDVRTGEWDLANASLCVIVMTPGFLEAGLDAVEAVRAQRLHIVPVVGVPGFRPAEWLALAIAGQLYYDLTKPDERLFEMSTKQDFVYAVRALIQEQATKVTFEAEEDQARALWNDVLAMQPQLEAAGKWPPQLGWKKRPVEEFGKDKDFNFINYEVTRMSDRPPEILDASGLPKRIEFDAMISYNWKSSQGLVRKLYENLKVYSHLNVWFDIWGGMRGDMNATMAYAVERSRALLVCLTEEYMRSPNCCLEFQYARSLRRPIAFVVADKSISPDQSKDPSTWNAEPWIKEAVNEALVFFVYSEGHLGDKVNGKGAPLVARLGMAVHNVIVSPTVTSTFGATATIGALEACVTWCRAAVDELAGGGSFEECTRCGHKFDDSSKAGCKNHSAYYMGGKILAGRWVCCSATDKNSVGCQDADHISIPRTWRRSRAHGTYTWEPR